MRIQIKRIYDTPLPDDGLRVLVDRLWPRGIRKTQPPFDSWLRELGPSHQLRSWFAHDDEKFAEFTQRYRYELLSKTDIAHQLLDDAGNQTLTLLYAARNTVSNHAVVLRDWLEEFAAENKSAAPRQQG